MDRVVLLALCLASIALVSAQRPVNDAVRFAVGVPAIATGQDG